MKNQLVVVGGSGGSGQRTIEVLSPTTISRKLDVELHENLPAPCVVPWDEDTLIVISKSSKTYFINMVTNKLSNGPTMQSVRGDARACNEMTVNGETFIVVAKGTKTEVLSKSSKSNRWMRGNDY